MRWRRGGIIPRTSLQLLYVVEWGAATWKGSPYEYVKRGCGWWTCGAYLIAWMKIRIKKMDRKGQFEKIEVHNNTNIYIYIYIYIQIMIMCHFRLKIQPWLRNKLYFLIYLYEKKLLYIVIFHNIAVFTAFVSHKCGLGEQKELIWKKKTLYLVRLSYWADCV